MWYSCLITPAPAIHKISFSFLSFILIHIYPFVHSVLSIHPAVMFIHLFSLCTYLSFHIHPSNHPSIGLVLIVILPPYFYGHCTSSTCSNAYLHPPFLLPLAHPLPCCHGHCIPSTKSLSTLHCTPSTWSNTHLCPPFLITLATAHPGPHHRPAVQLLRRRLQQPSSVWRPGVADGEPLVHLLRPPARASLHEANLKHCVTWTASLYQYMP